MIDYGGYIEYWYRGSEGNKGRRQNSYENTNKQPASNIIEQPESRSILKVRKSVSTAQVNNKRGLVEDGGLKEGSPDG